MGKRARGPFRSLFQGIGLLPPAFLQSIEQASEIVRRQVHHAQQRIAFRSQEHVQRPTGITARALDELDHACVQRRLQLPIHLDRNEIPVQERGDGRVTVGLALHDMTPVAGEIANGNEQRFVFAPSARKGIGVPFLPMDRIVAVHGQIRGGMTKQLVTQLSGMGRNAEQTQEQEKQRAHSGLCHGT